MKILIIHNEYQQRGGEYGAVEAQKQLLLSHGHEVFCYTRDNEEIQKYGLLKRAAFFPNTIYSISTYRKIRALVQKEEPAVAHVHNVFPLISPSVYQALHHAGVPIVQTVHNFRFLCPNGLFYTHGQVCERCKFGNTLHAVRWKCYRQSFAMSALYAASIGLNRWFGAFRLIDRFLALNPFTAEKLVQGKLVPPEKITILGNFLPVPHLEPENLSRKSPYLVYLGRLSKEKGVDILLQALQIAPRFELKVIGEGSELGSLKKMVSSLQIPGVQFLGQKFGLEKDRLLQSAAAVVIPSIWYEGFPLVALESMMLSTPVIAARIGNLPYLFEEGKSGLLYSPGDPVDLAAQITWVADHPQEAIQMGQNARQEAARRYSPEVHYNQLMTVYDELTANYGRN